MLWSSVGSERNDGQDIVLAAADVAAESIGRRGVQVCDDASGSVRKEPLLCSCNRVF